MTGILDHSAAEVPHSCDLPALLEFGPPRSSIGVPTIRQPHPPGTRFLCDGCARVHVVVWEPGGRYGNVYRAGGPAWRLETRRERRRRLGLRWWQRG